MIKGKDITFMFLYNKYVSFAYSIVFKKMEVSKDDASDIIMDVLTKIIAGIKTNKVFDTDMKLDKYVAKAINNHIVDLIRTRTGVTINSFTLTKGDILDWSALNQLLSDDRDKKVAWTNEFLRMDDDSDYTLSKDLNDAV